MNAEHPVGPLLGAIEQARTDANLLFVPSRLNAVADRMAATALEHGHRHVYGGSVFGHMLVGAVVSRCSRLSPWVPGTASMVLLIDGPIVGTVGLVQAAIAARRTGAVAVDALIVGSQGELGTHDNSAIDRLWTVEAPSSRVRLAALT